MWYVDNPYSVGVYFIRNVGTYLILLSNFVPISLWVTIELIKVGQSKFMSPYHPNFLLTSPPTPPPPLRASDLLLHVYSVGQQHAIRGRTAHAG